MGDGVIFVGDVDTSTAAVTRRWTLGVLPIADTHVAPWGRDLYVFVTDASSSFQNPATQVLRFDTRTEELSPLTEIKAYVIAGAAAMCASGP